MGMKLLPRHTAVYDKTVDVINKINNIYGLSLPIPKLTFDLRGRTGAIAYFADYRINYNDQLMSTNLQYFLDNLVAHEVCHLACNKLHPFIKDVHGKEWKDMMVTLGYKPDPRHTLDTTRVRTDRKPFACVNCGKQINLTLDQFSKWSNGVLYKHKPCQAPLVPIDINGNRL